MTECEVCLAAEYADESNLRALVRYQAVQLDRLRTDAETAGLPLAQALQRIRDLEETVARLNKKITRRTA